MLVSVALLGARLLLASIFAVAAKGGFPAEHSCGIDTGAHGVIEDQSGPGASKAALLPPSEAGCTGQG